MAVLTPGQAAHKMRDQADKAFRGLILECARRVILRTPVDTGRARGNWQITVGQATPSPDPERKDKSGGVTLLEVQARTNSVDSGEIVFLLNGISYIIYLERGSSQQAPRGMVAVTVAELQELAQQVAAEIRRVQ